MYGRIPPEYPQAAEFALKQWVWLEAVRRRAAAERPKPAAPIAPSPPEMESAPEETDQQAAEEEESLEPDWLGGRLRASGGWSAGVPIPTEPEPARAVSPPVILSPESEPLPAWLRSSPAAPVETTPSPSPARAPEPALPSRPPAVPSAVPAAAAVGEPAPNQRTRVTLRGDRVRFPINACAHCQRLPAAARWSVAGSLPRAASLGGRRTVTFRVPLCASCRRRAAANSGEQSNARLQAHLISALVSLAVIVGALALNLVSFDGDTLTPLAALGLLAVLGYAIPAVALLARAARTPVPPDAHFVRSTLLVRGSPLSLETVFAWRNAGYAEAFFQANQGASVGGPAATDEDAETV